jgi:hypothetical protein
VPQFLSKPPKPDAAPGLFRVAFDPLKPGILTSPFLKEIMTSTKEDFQHYCSNRFIESSAWRRIKTKKFPDDPRNARAAQRLLELESQIEIPDDVWETIEPFYSEYDTRFLAAVTDTNRDVGFRKHPRDFAAWLENLHSNLTRN